MGGAPPFGTVAPPVRRSPITRLGNPLNRANVLLTNLRSSHAAKELKKLQVFGAGPKMPGVAATTVDGSSNNSTATSTSSTLTSSLQTRSSSYVSISSAAPGATTNDSNEVTKSLFIHIFAAVATRFTHPITLLSTREHITPDACRERMTWDRKSTSVSAVCACNENHIVISSSSSPASHETNISGVFRRLD